MMGITLTTRVGRLSETHSDSCIPLHSIPRSKMVRERHGEKSREV